jgi:hypothetical protein
MHAPSCQSSSLLFHIQFIYLFGNRWRPNLAESTYSPILSLPSSSQTERRLRQVETEGKAAQLGWEDERLRLTSTIQTMETQVHTYTCGTTLGHSGSLSHWFGVSVFHPFALSILLVITGPMRIVVFPDGLGRIKAPCPVQRPTLNGVLCGLCQRRYTEG